MKKTTFICIISAVFAVSCTYEKFEPQPQIQPPAGACSVPVSYSIEIIPIISSKCSVPGCHVSGSGIPDFEAYSELKAEIDDGSVHNRVYVLKDMPPAGYPPLTSDEMETLNCWIAQGAPEN